MVGSVEGLQLRLIWDEDIAIALTAAGTLGACVSAAAGVLADAAADWADRFPAAS